MSREIVHFYPLFSGEMGISENLHELILKMLKSDIQTCLFFFFFFLNKQDVNVFLYFLQDYSYIICTRY